MDEQLKQSASTSRISGSRKIRVSPTKPRHPARSLALAYSPGVAAPCPESKRSALPPTNTHCPWQLVAVVSNGTAVLGSATSARYSVSCTRQRRPV